MKPTLQPVTVLHRIDQDSLRVAYSSFVLDGNVEDTSTAHEKMQLALDIPPRMEAFADGNISLASRYKGTLSGPPRTMAWKLTK